QQQTIERETSCSGIGLHTGETTRLTFKPAPINAGVRFVRTDLPGRPEIPADVEHVVDISRGTNLGLDGAEVRTVEHVLAAIAGLEIDNLVVDLDGIEPPVGDGSALPFVKPLLEAGIVEQDSPKDYLAIEEVVSYDDMKSSGVELLVLPSDDFKITFMSDPKNPTVGTQYTTMFSLDEFVKEYAPARTSSFLSEIEMLRERGLIKGGALDNAVVIVDKKMDEEELEHLRKLFGISDPIRLGTTGVLNDMPLRFPNEFCRHKVLDLIGDLFLLGMPIKGHVMGASSGHAANIELAKKIRKAVRKKQILSKYQGKTTQDKRLVFDVRAIQKIMPHRYPFLLMDRIIELVPGERVVGLKNVTINEQFFNGHFPGQPVMPGVLQIEAMAQVGGLLLLNAEDDPESKLVYFMGIDNARFRKPVVPGDQIRFELEMIRRRRTMFKMQGKAYVDGDLVAEAELMAMVVDRENEEG
ncbi:MAG: bifunctional UDP-3-O-[3-hydroxymyristoyl] N-acetylglucosamine deacetylase/3-hydroxyacyl-ACP dehydratase, partial [Candidatus Latescibacteria bacterium]|nr:bifunctional UDP-3-O-[3-hydroxymyristoyl] N-acetylglucosamine deacetylase/3-hydroxyacyl-ACP dehydratase [Candidatus Latescibacterota bacterium]